MNTRSDGIQGELIAKEYLQKQGYRIVQLNYSTKVGEIDIIAAKDGVAVFCEVKRRSSNKYGSGLESVTPDKIRKIIKTAEIFLLSKKASYVPCRFDVIVVGDSEVVEHVPNAFTKEDAGKKKHW